MELLDEYLMIFDDFPPMLACVTYKDEMYQELMKEAIRNRKPITLDVLNDYVDKHDIKFDVVQ